MNMGRKRLDPRTVPRYKPPKVDVVTKEDAVLDTEIVKTAIIRNKGVIYKVCEELGIGRMRFFGIAKKNKEVRMCLLEQKEAELDKSEAKLMDLRDMGNLGAVIFHLKTQGRRRGWKEKDTAEDGERPPVAINIKPAKGTQGSVTINLNQTDARDVDFSLEGEESEGTDTGGSKGNIKGLPAHVPG